MSEWDTVARLAQLYQAKPSLDWVGDGQGVHDLLAACSSQFTNTARMNTMGDLIVMSRRGQGNAPNYTRALHAAPTLARGKAALQKVGVNGGPRLQNS